MAGLLKRILAVLIVAFIVPEFAFGVQAQNSRSNNIKSVIRANSSANNNVSLRRSVTSVIARSVGGNNRRARTVVTARPVATRSAVTSSGRSDTRTATNNVGVSRATVSKTSRTRSASNKLVRSATKSGLFSRASSRPTTVFNDISKIGGDYASCRDAYATCMDQFCANFDDVYRRCVCSDKYIDFRNTSDNIDTAISMLTDFQNNNLNVIDKTAEEVNAMYSATLGEDAIKKDTSESRKLLDEIDDILSGSANGTIQTSSGRVIEQIDLTDFTDLGDIWSNTSDFMTDFSGSSDLSGLEGATLYRRAAAQCAELTKKGCSGNAMFNVASSAYSVMINQDCNIFEKSINAKKESVIQMVRDAEKVLREARLEEYRAHNSQDVNECLSRVEEAMMDPMACGENYVKCLDYTGEYINATTGEPIYSTQLFQMTSKISPVLGDTDIITANQKWNDFLETMKAHATSALDTCRSLADEVWTEFKRTALIRIAQAQDTKIQEVKDSCVSTISDCYNTQDGTLKELVENIDDKKLDTGAGRTLTVRGICYEKVIACAALYGDSSGCVYNSSTRKIEVARGGNNKCGLQALLDYVDTVDSSRIAKACEDAVSAYAHELCDPDPETTKYLMALYYDEDGNEADYTTLEYPAGCVNMPRTKLRDTLLDHAKTYCAFDGIAADRSNINAEDTSALNVDVVNRVLKDIFAKLNTMFTSKCADNGGVWIYTSNADEFSESDLNKSFYTKYYGDSSMESVKLGLQTSMDSGVCLVASEENICKVLGKQFNVSYNRNSKMCELPDSWYTQRCKTLNGVWNSSQCVIQ